MVDDVYWVGVNDWAVRIFHGYHTDEGSSYNSYIIMDEQPTLVDTVKYPFAEEFMERVSSVIPFEQVKYVVMNHAEGDHSSSLPIIIKKMPQATIVTNRVCKLALETLYPSLLDHKNWMIVDQNSKLNIGKRTLTFIPTPLIHWPDNMFTYSEYDKVLFSNDGFGQHLASVERWADQLPLERVMRLLREYNANILGHLPALLSKALAGVSGLEIKTILTAHGVGWRGETLSYALKEYTRFASKKYLKKVTIMYDSMYNSTARVAVAMTEGVRSVGAKCEILDLKSSDITKVALHMYDSASFAIGSPTLNSTMMPLIESAISYVRGLKLLEGKPCALFGAYGWNGKSVADMKEAVARCGATNEDSMNMQWKLQVNDKILAQAY